MRPATLIVALVAVQVTLGALTVLSRRDPLDQQLPRRLRRAGADDVAGDHAAHAGASRLRTCGLPTADSTRIRPRSVRNPIRNPHSAIRNDGARA